MEVSVHEIMDDCNQSGMSPNVWWLPLPRLNNTKVTDRGAQALLDIDRDVRKRRGTGVDWSELKISHTNIADVGTEALARTFVKTNTRGPNPLLWYCEA